MSVIIPHEFADLLTREKKAYAHLALVLKDGTPHVTPIWFEWDGTHIVVNTARGRIKDKVMRRHPNVAVSITDPAEPERYMQIRGRVVEETEDGAWEKICDLREKYRGDRNFKRVPGQVRVIYKILPERVYAE
ncbi:MAG: PPOX class F420-dependent oxidoreductase [Chloroflexi bacterium]|nr:PPOX class F420-dependent oxidoreductase [Chloroflexota bacterium]